MLVQLAKEVGLPVAEVTHLFESADFAQEVREDENMAAQFGISGVPFFVFNRKVALSGAQPVDVFLDVLNQNDN